ncbi:hypothetical protein [Nocardiopsis sp. CNR-923]|nr:hypothetical protein [Nocardiopsis sp. CNR-923]
MAALTGVRAAVATAGLLLLATPLLLPWNDHAASTEHPADELPPD